MPRRHHREQILEVTKTVTVTEIVNHGAGKHPRACEVTITNLESDTSHPVSVKISHMHEGKRLDHNEAGTQTPKIQVDEDTWDAVRTPANGTTKIVQEQESRVERIRRINPPVTTTFNLASDNIIDLHFTQPVLIEKADKQTKSSTAAARHTATADDKTMYKTGPVQKLYYQTFSGSDGLLEETGVTKATISSPSPTAAASATSVRTAGQSTAALPRSSVLDETDVSVFYTIVPAIIFDEIPKRR
ncbi:unnamed protein product [Cylicostephanus goldi]|uniref:Uncharacterized protein n=1 Tax=Cylicostephanus goldi TaxID=71465 RepID=A0A3P7NKH8_CYLGO|nr:unnamed protein product [Cylicostephanus goldi]